MPAHRLAKVVQLVRHRFVDRLARVLHVLAELLTYLVERNRLPRLFAAALRPLGAARAGASRRGSRHLARFARERPRRPFAARAHPNEQRYSRSRHEAERGRREQVEFIALTPAPRVAAV